METLVLYEIVKKLEIIIIYKTTIIKGGENFDKGSTISN